MQSLCGLRVAAALLAAACCTPASASNFREARRGGGTLAADDGDGRKGVQAGASARVAADGAKEAPPPAASTSRWWGRPASLISVKGLVRFGTLARLREATAEHGPLLTGLSTLVLVLAVWVTRGFQRGKGFGGCSPVAAAAAAVVGGAPSTGGNAVEPLRACVRRTAHTLSARELEGALDSSLEHASLGTLGGPVGVDEAALLRQRELFGENRLTPPQRESPFVLLLKQIFGGLFNIMLWVCVACELVLALALDGDDIVTPAVLSAVIVASGALQWWTERQAENMMNALQGMQAASRVLVHRKCGGRPVEEEVPAEDLVPGDVVLLEAGQRVPADVRILACSDGALVENSALTGESVAEPRTSEVAPSGQALMEARNVAFCGTVVLQGKLLCVVFGTGDNTLLGQIAAKIRTSRTRSSLEIQIEHFVHLIALVAVGVGLFSLAANVVSPRKRNVAEILENAATAFFAQVPEGLLPTVTVCLMIASKQMAKRQVLVRKIDAVETLGCIGVLCSDKTGTLTSGNMTATDFAVPPAQVEETAARDEDSECGEEGLLEVQPASCEAPSDALAALARCGLLNNATRPEKGGGTGLVGSPTEVAILAGCRRILGDLRADAVSAALPQVFEIPFNSGSKWMLTIHLVTASAREELPGEEVATDGATFLAVLKGAPERVLKLCTAEPEICARADVSLNRLMSQGKRVLCLAEKMLHGLAPDFKFSGSSPEDANFAMEGFTFKGLVALEDPPKPGAADAVARIARAGARTVMVTGDHPATAEAIARRIGVIPAACGSGDGVASAYLVITGAALEEHLPPNDCFDFAGAEKDSEMAQFWTRCVEHTCVFARVSPMHKRTIVRAFQQIGGHVVAMTGDGVNDAPALKEAEVGIAMGVRGTEVAKEAADIVLLDDDLQSVVAGMEQGRLCSENLRKSIMYTLCSKLPQVLPTFFELAGVPSALSAAQVLLIDIGTDIWTAIAFAWQPAEGELMLRPPRHPQRDRMVDGQVLFYSYGYIGVIQSAACWLVFFGAIPRMYELFLADKHPSEYSVADSEADYVGMTSYYWTLVLGQVGAALAATTTRQSALQGWAPNIWLTACIAGEILLALLVVMWAPLQQLFKTRGLSAAQLAAGLLGFVLVSAIEELRKMWLRRQDFNAAGRRLALLSADAKAGDPESA